jgi:hypothetical protein
MKRNQCKKLFGTEGTQKSRKQFAIARRRGKTPNNYERTPHLNPDKILVSKEAKLEQSYRTKVDKMLF